LSHRLEGDTARQKKDGERRHDLPVIREKWLSYFSLTQWNFRGITKGRVEISKDLRYGCYLFPRTKAAVSRMKQLNCGEVRQVIFRKEHGDD
jgi:hypothetical protein